MTSHTIHIIPIGDCVALVTGRNNLHNNNTRENSVELEILQKTKDQMPKTKRTSTEKVFEFNLEEAPELLKNSSTDCSTSAALYCRLMPYQNSQRSLYTL